MDGFHLSRSQLDKLPDPATAHARRGAAFTFDGAGWAGLVHRLRTTAIASAPRRIGGGDDDEKEVDVIVAPSFSHAAKDPVADGVVVGPGHGIVVLEGLWLAYSAEPWSGAAAEMDEVWFVEVGERVAEERLWRRHVEAGIAADEEAGRRRVRESDGVNAREIMAGRGRVDEVVVSLEDEAWKV
jgi:pantothenate kinase